MKRRAADEPDEQDFHIYASSSDESPTFSNGHDAPDIDNEDNDSVSSEEEAGGVSLEDPSSQSGATETIETDIEFYDPLLENVAQVTRYFTNYLGGVRGDQDVGGAIANAICGQRRVGTVVKLGEGEIIGVVSVLNCRRFREVLKGVDEELRKRARDGKSRQMGGGGRFSRELDRIWGKTEEGGDVDGKEGRTGLMFLEGVMNLPVELLPSMHQALFDEIKWATEDEPTQELRDSFRFERYLLITTCFVVDGSKRGNRANVATRHQGRKHKKKRRRGNGLEKKIMEDEELAFTRPDCEAWYAHSSHSLRWPLPKDAADPPGMTKSCIAMILPAAKVDSMRDRTKELISQSTGMNGGGHPETR